MVIMLYYLQFLSLLVYGCCWALLYVCITHFFFVAFLWQKIFNEKKKEKKKRTIPENKILMIWFLKQMKVDTDL